MLQKNFRESLEELESFYRQKEDRLRTAHSEHVEELERRVESLSARNRALLDAHEAELEEERARRKAEAERMQEEHR